MQKEIFKDFTKNLNDSEKMDLAKRMNLIERTTQRRAMLAG